MARRQALTVGRNPKQHPQMKKVALLVTILAALLFWFGESRHFYCLNNRCLTVWKTFNNICYIIPGKYYGLVKPSDNFIATTNTNNLTIYFTGQLPKTFFIKGDEKIKIYNTDKTRFVLLDYEGQSQTFDSILYNKNATKFNDLKENASLIEIFVKENYATDKSGKKL